MTPLERSWRALDVEIEGQIRDLKRAIERRPDVDELVARLEERETMLARMRATIAMEARGAA